jgi:hypothetical protein
VSRVSAPEGTSAILADFVRIISTKLIIREAEPTLYAPWMPDVNLLRDFDVVIDLDAEVANGALDLVYASKSWTARKFPVRR